MKDRKSYHVNARAACASFLETIDSLEEGARNKVRSLNLAKTREFDELVDSLTEATLSVDRTIDQFERTGLDIVDAEQRFVQETNTLVDAALEIEAAALKSNFTEAYRFELSRLEQALQELACALYPSSAIGLKEVNHHIVHARGDFKRMANTIERLESRDDWPEDTKAAVSKTIRHVRKAFDTVNKFLNTVAYGELSKTQARDAFAEARETAHKGVVRIRGKSEDRHHRGVRSHLDRLAKRLIKIEEDLPLVEIPIFPNHDDLEELEEAISEEFYAGLAGPQKFALLNIAARMRSIEDEDDKKKTLLDSEFKLNVWRVYTDRFYFDTESSLIDRVAIREDFETAPAALHRFNEKSYKQKRFDKGNLQLSYQAVDEFKDAPVHSERRLHVDADVDLFRNPLSHLFGEVLKNHLTGSKTDQLIVRAMLDAQGVRPIGGFEIASIA